MDELRATVWKQEVLGDDKVRESVKVWTGMLAVGVSLCDMSAPWSFFIEQGKPKAYKADLKEDIFVP